mgnify:CR=1 FL=1
MTKIILTMTKMTMMKTTIEMMMIPIRKTINRKILMRRAIERGEEERESNDYKRIHYFCLTDPIFNYLVNILNIKNYLKKAI